MILSLANTRITRLRPMLRLIARLVVPIHTVYELDPMRHGAYTTVVRAPWYLEPYFAREVFVRLQATVLYLSISMNTFRLLDKQRNLNKDDFEHCKWKPWVLVLYFQTSRSQFCVWIFLVEIVLHRLCEQMSPNARFPFAQQAAQAKRKWI